MRTNAKSTLPSALGGRRLQPAEANAFTLIELLVVIAVIAILAALLLPALAKAKGSARRVECINHHRQWAMAFQQYADDNEGRMPREGFHADGSVYWNNWAQVQNAASKDVWYNALPDYLQVKAASKYAPPANRLPFYERASFFHCPSARFPKVAESVAYQTALFSMAMNSQLINPPSVGTVQLSRIADTARTVLFLDNLLEDEKPVVPQQAADNLGQPSAYANRFAGRRHGRGGTLAFADGHTEVLPGEKVVETRGFNVGWAILPPVEVRWELDEEQ